MYLPREREKITNNGNPTCRDDDCKRCCCFHTCLTFGLYKIATRIRLTCLFASFFWVAAFLSPFSNAKQQLLWTSTVNYVQNMNSSTLLRNSICLVYPLWITLAINVCAATLSFWLLNPWQPVCKKGAWIIFWNRSSLQVCSAGVSPPNYSGTFSFSFTVLIYLS